MSVETALEKLRAETPEEDEEAAEAEEAETTPETPDDDDAQTAPPTLPDVDPDALEKESKRHERAMAKVLGAAWDDAEPCEACGTLGYVPKGAEPLPEMLPNPNLVKCRGCNGWGKRLTPALDPQYATEPCTDCQGKGFVDRATYETMVTPAAPQPFAGAPMPPPMPRWDEARGIWVDQFGTAIGTATPLQPYTVNGPGTP